MGYEHFAQATRAATGEVFHVRAHDVEHALADGRAERRVGHRRVGRQADGGEVLRGLVVVDGDGRDGTAGDVRHHRRELRLRDELGAGDVVDAVLVAVAGEGRGGGGGAVLARHVSGRAVAVVVDQLTRRDGPRRGRDLEL